MEAEEKSKLFQLLRSILAAYEKNMTCTEDSAESYNLFTQHMMKNKKPLYFGGIKINKSAVSFHFMPVYLYPDLLDSMAPELKSKLSGKSCFTIKSNEKEVLAGLKALAKIGFDAYRKAGYV